MFSLMGAVFVWLVVFIWLLGVRVYRDGFTSLGETEQTERSNKFTSAVLSEWRHINTLLLKTHTPCIGAMSTIETRVSG